MKKMEFIKTERGYLYSPRVAKKEKIEGKKVLRTKRDLIHVREWGCWIEDGDYFWCCPPTAKMLRDVKFRRQLQKAGVIE